MQGTGWQQTVGGFQVCEVVCSECPSREVSRWVVGDALLSEGMGWEELDLNGSLCSAR